MEKSFALVLPDRPGMFREVMRIFSEHSVSMLRVSYNRVVDIHTLFVDVNGSMAALGRVERDLRLWRFLPGQRTMGEVRVLELDINMEQGMVEQALVAVERHELNITYVDARTDGLGDDKLRLGVFVHSEAQLRSLCDELGAMCDVRLVEKSERPNMLDNNHFNLSFAQGLARRLNLTDAGEEEILINSNRIMQNLMGENADPYQPFDLINKIAETVASYQDGSFAENCRITRLATAGGVGVVCVEPPVGSNTWVFECDECLLCVDAGYCCFADDLASILRGIYPDWDERTKKLVLTHGDIDHVGACHLFDEVFATGRTINNFEFERLGIVGWREQNPMAYPYVRIGNVLSGYRTPDTENMTCLGEHDPLGEQQELLRQIGTLSVNPLCFEVWEGKGGHVRGETVLVERSQRVCVSGDIFVNVHGETKPQSRYNALAPALMTSADSVPDLAREERAAMFGLLGEGAWQIMGGHGAVFAWGED